ncbi:MAG: cellulase family glycosylhydrolase, partial [Ruminococcus sp.]|nr:cellulase family glycosylhydrolase [Ruminococcus sp.]
ADRRDNSPYIGAWWGGNFRGAREYPITPKHGTSQIVYSPHDYGPSVYAQTWFDKDFTTQTLLDDYWYDTWAYINAENIAPELIGEWGGHMDGAENQKWMELLRDYMIEHHINHTFWCLNTNSGDTGGLWKNISCGQQQGSTQIEWEKDKYELMEPSLWQTQETGKYIGLDHQRPLGDNGTGISLNEFYTSYAATEGSNLDGGTIVKDGKPVNIDSSGTTTTATTKKSDTTTTTTTAVSNTTGNSDINYGDADENGEVGINDAVLIMQSIANPDKYKLTSQGKLNADVFNHGDGITNNDALIVQYVESKTIKVENLPVGKDFNFPD